MRLDLFPFILTVAFFVPVPLLPFTFAPPFLTVFAIIVMFTISLTVKTKVFESPFEVVGSCAIPSIFIVPPVVITCSATFFPIPSIFAVVFTSIISVVAIPFAVFAIFLILAVATFLVISAIFFVPTCPV